MKINDAASVTPGSIIETDIVIIGSGPAGLSIARELEASGKRALIIESGGNGLDADAQTLNAVERTDACSEMQTGGRGYVGSVAWLNNIPVFELRHRSIGGSTATWFGKSAAFQEIDFRKRDWVQMSGWPISLAAMQPYIERAATFLNLGPNLYDDRLRALLKTPPADLPIDPERLSGFFWQFSQASSGERSPLRLGNELHRFASERIPMLTRATALGVTVENGRRVRGLRVAGPGGDVFEVHAPRIVLAAGAIENARLLLASADRSEQAPGNARGLLGRYLSEHPRAIVCNFDAAGADRIQGQYGFYALKQQIGKSRCLYGLALSDRVQQAEGLLNCAAYIVKTHCDSDPWLAAKRLVAGYGTAKDFLKLTRDPLSVLSGVQRHFRGQDPLPKVSHLRFDAMVEQAPDSENRVTLSARRDRFGAPLARVAWRVSRQEAATAARMGELILEQFARVGLPKPSLPDWIVERDYDNAPFHDMGHPSGTTRMGDAPSNGVVDTGGQVFGVDGLYVAGSSTFPTSGHANPTLMIVAQSMMVADRVKADIAVRTNETRRVAAVA